MLPWKARTLVLSSFLLVSMGATSAESATSCLESLPLETGAPADFRFDLKPACKPRPVGKGPKVSAVHGICKEAGFSANFTGTCVSHPGTVVLTGLCRHPSNSFFDKELRTSGPDFFSMSGEHGGATAAFSSVDCKAVGLK